MTDPPNTPPETLVRAATIGQTAGLRYLYAGNLPGWTDGLEDTICSGCGELLVSRRGFRVIQNRLRHGGACAACGRIVPGYWD